MTPRRANPTPAWSDEQVLELVRVHQGLVRAYLRTLGCPPDQVEDLAQETFLRLFRSPAHARSAGQLRGFLCTTARNLLHNTYRAAAAEPRIEPLENAWAALEGADGGSAYVEALRGCLERLPERTREILRLRFGCDMPRAAIAERLESSLGGVKSVLLRSKEQLRECVRRKLQLDQVDSHIDSMETTS